MEESFPSTRKLSVDKQNDLSSPHNSRSRIAVFRQLPNASSLPMFPNTTQERSVLRRGMYRVCDSNAALIQVINHLQPSDKHRCPWRTIKQDRQYTYNVTLKRVRESLLLWKSNKYYIFFSVRLCACVCASGRVGVA
jgi:hypothetical protein